jgi:hypothetical protein
VYDVIQCYNGRPERESQRHLNSAELPSDGRWTGLLYTNYTVFRRGIVMDSLRNRMKNERTKIIVLEYSI